MSFHNNQLKINTKDEHWVIPWNCELLKAILEHQNLTAKNLRFSSMDECNNFIKQLFLLALEDQMANHIPSELAILGRELMTIQQSNNNYI